MQNIKFLKPQCISWLLGHTINYPTRTYISVSKNLQILHVHIWRIWKWRWDFVESESSIAKDFFLDLDLICTASPTKVGRAHFQERLLSQKLKSLGAKS